MLSTKSLKSGNQQGSVSGPLWTFDTIRVWRRESNALFTNQTSEIITQMVQCNSLARVAGEKRVRDGGKPPPTPPGGSTDGKAHNWRLHGVGQQSGSHVMGRGRQGKLGEVQSLRVMG